MRRSLPRVTPSVRSILSMQGDSLDGSQQLTRRNIGIVFLAVLFAVIAPDFGWAQSRNGVS
jgi:hypothetical protein